MCVSVRPAEGDITLLFQMCDISERSEHDHNFNAKCF